jgi:hypothetical protein
MFFKISPWVIVGAKYLNRGDKRPPFELPQKEEVSHFVRNDNNWKRAHPPLNFPLKTKRMAFLFPFLTFLIPGALPLFQCITSNLKGDSAPAVTQVKIVLKFFLEFSPFFKVNNSLFTIFYQTLPSRGFKKFSKNSYKFFFFSYIRPTNSQKSSIFLREFLDFININSFACF